MDSRRQRQVAKLLQEEMAALFLKHGRDWYGQAFLTITEATVTPDLAEARFYISVFNVEDKAAVMARLNSHAPDVRYHLGQRIRHQLRHIPDVQFILDDGMERAARVEELLKGD
jgi:ribosome-binding factor A